MTEVRIVGSDNKVVIDTNSDRGQAHCTVLSIQEIFEATQSKTIDLLRLVGGQPQNEERPLIREKHRVVSSNRPPDNTGSFTSNELDVYLNTIGNIPLLSREEEIKYGKKIQNLTRRLRHQLGCLLPVQEMMLAIYKDVQQGRVPETKALDVKAVIRDKNIEDDILYSDTLYKRDVCPAEHLEDFCIQDILPSTIQAIREGLDERSPDDTEILGKQSYLMLEMPLLMEIMHTLHKKMQQQNEEWQGVADEEFAVKFGKSKSELAESLQQIDETKRALVQHEQGMAESNTKLAVTIAKSYRHRGLSFLDLIQAGGEGVMRAVKRWQYQKGYKFGTYAGWWIIQAIKKAILDKAKLVRLNADAYRELAIIRDARSMLWHNLGRKPTHEQIAEAVGMKLSRVNLILQHERAPLSWQHPVDGNEGGAIGDFQEDTSSPSAIEEVTQNDMRDAVENALNTLTYREREVLKLRFGLGDGYSYTLEQVGRIFKVTREWARQIQEKALKKLQEPRRRRRLERFIDE